MWLKKELTKVKLQNNLWVLLWTTGYCTSLKNMLHELVFGVGKKELKSFMINEERINEIYFGIYDLFCNHKFL